jgi:hypothetical protein
MLTYPWPPCARGVEARAVVGDREQQAARLLPEPDVDLGFRGVLGGVLQCLQAAEVDGRLDLLGHRPMPSARTRTG